MKVFPPFTITSRLLQGVRIGQGEISIEIEAEEPSGRTRFRYFIDGTVDGRPVNYSSNDLRSGCQGGDIRSGLESLLSFLSAAAEAYGAHQRGRTSDNADLFPPEVMEWADYHEEELSALACELEAGGEQ